MKTYDVEIERDETGYWVASVPQVPGCHSQGRSIQQVRERIREALSLFVKNAATAKIVVHVQVPREIHGAVARTKIIREKAQAAAEKAHENTREAVLFLTKQQKLSVRDVGELLGISHQRVQQLLSS